MTGVLIDNSGCLLTNDPTVGQGPLGHLHNAVLVPADGVVGWAGRHSAVPEGVAGQPCSRHLRLLRTGESYGRPRVDSLPDALYLPA